MSPCHRIVLATITLLAAAIPAPARAADGLLDETFSTDGRLLVGSSGGTLPAQGSAAGSFPDGSLLVAGEVEVASSNPDLGFVKITAGGLIDAGWGDAGRRIVAIDAEPGADDSVRALAILPDGSAIAAGFSTFYFPDAQSPTYRPALVRLDADGNLESTFGDAGVALIDLPWPTGDFGLNDPVMQRDGKAIYAGYCYDCPLQGDGRSTLLLRVGTDGVPDSTFSGDGWIRESTGDLGTFSTALIAVDGAGRIVLQGDLDGQSALLRLTASGKPIPRSAVATVSSPSRDPSDSRIRTSWRSTVRRAPCIGRTTRPGAPTKTTARCSASRPTGRRTRHPAATAPSSIVYQERIVIEGLAVQSDGKIVAGGYRLDQQTTDREWMLYRLTPAGALDNSFNGNGRRLVDFGQPAGLGEGIHALGLSGGRVVAVGNIEVGGVNRFGIARITSDLIFRDGFERASAGGWGGN